MRWFTRDWISGSLPSSTDDVPVVYQAHLSSIWPNLSDDIRAFARPRDGRLAVHDACVDEVAIDQRSGTLRMALLSGSLPVGYAKLMIEFTGFKLLSPPIENLTKLLSDPLTQFGYEEMDLAADGGESPFEVRFILFPRGELEFGFKSLEATYEALADPSELPCRYLVRMEA